MTALLSFTLVLLGTSIGWALARTWPDGAMSERSLRALVAICLPLLIGELTRMAPKLPLEPLLLAAFLGMAGGVALEWIARGADDGVES